MSPGHTLGFSETPFLLLEQPAGADSPAGTPGDCQAHPCQTCLSPAYVRRRLHINAKHSNTLSKLVILSPACCAKVCSGIAWVGGGSCYSPIVYLSCQILRPIQLWLSSHRCNQLCTGVYGLPAGWQKEKVGTALCWFHCWENIAGGNSK